MNVKSGFTKAASWVLALLLASALGATAALTAAAHPAKAWADGSVSLLEPPEFDEGDPDDEGSGSGDNGSDSDSGTDDSDNSGTGTDKPGASTGDDAPAAAYAVLYTDGTLIFQVDDTAAEGKTIVKAYPVDIEGTTAPAWSENASRIRSVEVEEFMYTHSTAGWFKGFSACSSFDLTYLITDRCTDFSEMFSGASRVQRISLYYQKSSAATTMAGMFSGCTSLKYVLMPGFDTSAVTDFSDMFKNCRGMTILNLTNFDNGAAQKSTGMLSGLASLRGLFLGESFDIQTETSTQAACGLSEPITPAVYLASDYWYDGAGVAYLCEDLPSNVTKSFAAYQSGSIYADVASDAWYRPFITDASEMGYVSGQGGSVGRGAMFTPLSSLTRAELAQILANMAGADLTAYVNQTPFTDVSEYEWYAAPIAWAKDMGITRGYANGETYHPFDVVSRAELAVFLGRYAEMLGDVKLDGHDTAILSQYRDSAKVPSWAREAVAWALDGKIMGMYTDGTRQEYMYPDRAITRAEVCTMVIRYQPRFLVDGKSYGDLDIPTGELPVPAKPDTPDEGDNTGGSGSDGSGTGGSGTGGSGTGGGNTGSSGTGGSNTGGSGTGGSGSETTE